MAHHPGDDLAAAPSERVHRHHRAGSRKKRDRIGIGAAGAPRADAVHHRISADRDRSEQRKSDRLAIERRDVAAASQRQQYHSAYQQDDAAPAR